VDPPLTTTLPVESALLAIVHQHGIPPLMSAFLIAQEIPPISSTENVLNAPMISQSGMEKLVLPAPLALTTILDQRHALFALKVLFISLPIDCAKSPDPLYEKRLSSNF